MGGALEGDRPAPQQDLLDFNPATATLIEALSSFKATAVSLGVEASVAPVHNMHEVRSFP